MTSFCSDLQHPWGLRSLEVPRGGQVSVTAVASYNEGVPPIQGRHVDDISSYPRVWRDYFDARFDFDEVVWLEVRDENAATLSDSETAEGKTFLRFLGSKLLRLQRLRWGEGTPMAVSLLHYRLICGDTHIDVVCRKAPTVTKRPLREPDSPIA